MLPAEFHQGTPFFSRRPAADVPRSSESNQIPMSLHVQLSPEALENLRRQRRNSTISSILASILTIAVIALVLGIFLLPNLVQESPTIVTYESSQVEEEQIQEKKVNTQVQKKPSAPSSSMTKVIAANATSTVSIPVPEVDVTTPSLEFGDGQDFGGGWGDSGDFGSGGGFGRIPQDMRKRCSPQDRLQRLKESGGTEACEEAVVKALDYLQKTQNPDGSWDQTHPVAMTGFALLAYLGHCETPKSEKYGDTVLKAITYLVNNGLQNKGRLTNKPEASIQWVYDHGIASYALCEAYTFCSKLDIEVPDLEKVTKKAIEMIIDGQTEQGGWVYRFGKSGGGDNSVGFWQIQAMKAAKHTGIFSDSKFSKPSKLALKWLSSVQSPEGAIGYRNDPNRSPYLTGGGVLAFQIWGEGNSKEARKGIDYIDKHSQFVWGNASANLYYHYYNIQAMLNHGGKEWDKYNKMVRDALVKAQNPDGSWTQNVGSHGPINTHMATCLATLSLEAYYRFLPGSAK